MKIVTFFSAIVIFSVALVASPLPALAQDREADAAAQLAFGQMERDERVDALRAYLATHDSPLEPESGHFVSEADRLGLDWKLVASIAGTESTFGKRTPPGSHNAWGWGIPTASQSGIAFASWKQGITTVSEGLRERYIDQGAATIGQIGRIYAASPRWEGNVRFFLNQIEAFTPEDPAFLIVTL